MKIISLKTALTVISAVIYKQHRIRGMMTICSLHPYYTNFAFRCRMKPVSVSLTNRHKIEL